MPEDAGSSTGGGGSGQASRGRGNRSRGRGDRGGQNRSGGGRGGRGKGNRGGRQDGMPAEPAAQDVAAAARAAKEEAGIAAPAHKATQKADDEGDDDAEVCFICANPVAHHSIAPCNHTTCHICGLRMRALYKTKDCAHCRVRRTAKPPYAPIID